MLKKVSVLMLTLLYVISVPGFALNLHYCGKTITAVKFNAPAKGCVKNPAARKMKCCNDKRVDIKIKDAHESQPAQFLSKVFSLQLPAFSLNTFCFKASEYIARQNFDRGPPERLLSSIPTFLKNQAFRI